ncbi:hypothetical protein D9M69_587350 [compost metagenome]
MGQRPGERRGVLDDGIECVTSDDACPEPFIQLIQDRSSTLTSHFVGNQAGSQGGGHIGSRIGGKAQFTQRTDSTEE